LLLGNKMAEEDGGYEQRPASCLLAVIVGKWPGLSVPQLPHLYVRIIMVPKSRMASRTKWVNVQST
jgi:hypothetical protein